MVGDRNAAIRAVGQGNKLLRETIASTEGDLFRARAWRDIRCEVWDVIGMAGQQIQFQMHELLW